MTKREAIELLDQLLQEAMKDGDVRRAIAIDIALEVFGEATDEEVERAYQHVREFHQQGSEA